MKESEIVVMESKLREMKGELQALESTSTASTATVVLDQTSVGRLSRMDALQGQQMALESVRRRKTLLLKIEAALNRIEAGQFGYCVICEEEIPSERLSIDPTATRCVGCSEKRAQNAHFLSV
jgi:DnaK suppressor protein